MCHIFRFLDCRFNISSWVISEKIPHFDKMLIESIKNTSECHCIFFFTMDNLTDASSVYTLTFAAKEILSVFNPTLRCCMLKPPKHFYKYTEHIDHVCLTCGEYSRDVIKFDRSPVPSDKPFFFVLLFPLYGKYTKIKEYLKVLILMVVNLR